MKNSTASSGFTLIELLVTIVIIGVLAGLAIPSYFNSVRKSNRTEATVALSEAAQQLQKCYTVYGAYNSNSCLFYKTSFVDSPQKIITGKGYYQITISNPPNSDPKTTFTLTATAILAPQTKDIAACQKLTLTQNGTKGDATSTATSPTTCW